jgi:hypothetical protein
MRKGYIFIGVFLVFSLAMLAAVLFIEPIRERAAWRIGALQTRIFYALNPPDQVIFIPKEGASPTPQTGMPTREQDPTPTRTPTQTASPVPTQTPTVPGPTSTPVPTATLTPTLTPSPTQTPIPEAVLLSGIRHEWQSFNNCGPANLAMALSYWGWVGDQRDTRAYLRPHPDDYNVMPEEMVRFVDEETELQAVLRVGGDLELLKRMVAAGYPVIVEKGYHPSDDWWMGHYVVVSGYDEGRQRFITQDSLVMADFPVPYETFSEGWWRDFNYVYLVIYPEEKEEELMDLLGPHADADFNFRHALELAEEEIPHLSGRDLFFAWYNKGANLTALGEYQAAAEAFDHAFELYAAIQDKDRPWRIFWYRIEPYPAYFHTGRYQDVIQLANTAISRIGKGGLEESYYWRGLARAAIGETDRAIADLQNALRFNTNFLPAREELQRLGVETQ